MFRVPKTSRSSNSSAGPNSTPMTVRPWNAWGRYADPEKDAVTPEVIAAERRQRARIHSEGHHRWGRHDAGSVKCRQPIRSPH
jgi:hypothetical protein